MAVTAVLASFLIGGGKNADPPGLWELLIMQFLGMHAIHAAIYARDWKPKLPKPLEFLFGNVLFGALGLYFFVQAWRGLAEQYTGPEWRMALLLAYIAMIGSLHYRSWQEWRGAETWPTTIAKIESKEVNRVTGKHSHHFVAELAYSYVVQGEFYAGYYKREFDSELDAWEFADSLTGKSVPIHYKPDHPAISVLPDSVATSEADSFQSQH